MFRYLYAITSIILLVISANVSDVSKEDEIHTCDVHFSVEVLDKKNIKGVGLKDETIKLYINNEYVDETKGNEKDEFKFELKDDLKHDDIIQVELGKNKLKLKYDDTKESNITSFEGTFDCSDLQMETEEQNEEIEGTDSDTDNDKKIGDISENDVNEENNIEEDKENEKGDEVEDNAKNNEEKSEEEAEKDADDTEEDIDKVKEESSDNKKSDPDVKEEKKSLALRSTETEKLIDTEKVCESTNEYNKYVSDYLNNGAIPQKVQGKVQCVSTASEFDTAVTNRDVEVILLKNDIEGADRKSFSSNYDQKIIDGNGYALIMDGSKHLTKTDGSITNIIVKDVSNLFTENNKDIEGMFRATSPGHLRLINSNFNINNDPSGGHIGASWESTLHFYGKVIMNTNAKYGAYYRYYKVHENSHLELNASQGGLHAKSNSKDHVDSLNGIQLLDNAYAAITSKDHSLFSGGNFLKHVESGKNSQLFLTSKNSHAVEFERKNDFFVQAHDNGLIILTSPNSPFVSRGNGDIEIDNKGTLELYKQGTGNTQPVFDVTNSININIYYPKNVDFKNDSGPIFNSHSATKEFKVKYTAIKGFTKSNVETPSYETSAFTDGIFNMRNNQTTTTKGNFPTDFTNKILPSLQRLQFKGEIDAKIDVKSPILDTDTKVTGSGNKNSEIQMVNTRTDKVYKTTSDNNGNFVFQFEKRELEADDKLEFYTVVAGYNVLGAEKTVEGTQLELRPIENIEFEETEIKNQPNHIIYRSKDKHSVEVLNTKGSNFNVDVYSEGPLKNDKDTIPDALYFVQDNQYYLIEGKENRQVIGTKDSAIQKNSNYIFDFDKDSGILLKLNPIDVHKQGTYRTKLTWTLTDGP